MNVKTLILCLFLANPALGQGFAGLGTDAEGFEVPQRGTELSFPTDHGAHPAYRIEWWYLTANLTGDDGRQYGVQWTLFRSALRPETGQGWTSPQIWMGHAGLTTPESHYHAERLARGGVGHAGVTAVPFRAWIDEWQMSGAEGPGDALDQLSVRASSANIAYDLDLTATGPLIAHGQKGYSVKSAEGQASYYYSQPFYQVRGTLVLPEGDVQVTGQAWLDREWSSQPLADDQKGWDWVSLHFEDGTKLMGFRLRDTAGGDFTSGTWIEPDGSVAPFGDGTLKMTPLETTLVENRHVPTRWRIELPGRDMDIEIGAVNPQAWMDTSFPYWEGPVTISGSHTGMGYLEMTGY